ncbi:hypothetical protein Pelo_16648 [Pelomyxa schiedti]|nr:hypothetical protein Pelo_16648 [Pelomyxa schiedti]
MQTTTASAAASAAQPVKILLSATQVQAAVDKPADTATLSATARMESETNVANARRLEVYVSQDFLAACNQSETAGPCVEKMKQAVRMGLANMACSLLYPNGFDFPLRFSVEIVTKDINGDKELGAVLIDALSHSSTINFIVAAPRFGLSGISSLGSMMGTGFGSKQAPLPTPIAATPTPLTIPLPSTAPASAPSVALPSTAEISSLCTIIANGASSVPHIKRFLKTAARTNSGELSQLLDQFDSLNLVKKDATSTTTTTSSSLPAPNEQERKQQVETLVGQLMAIPTINSMLPSLLSYLLSAQQQQASSTSVVSPSGMTFAKLPGSIAKAWGAPSTGDEEDDEEEEEDDEEEDEDDESTSKSTVKKHTASHRSNSGVCSAFFFKCTICPNFFLCPNCEDGTNHDPQHPFLKVRSADTPASRLTPYSLQSPTSKAVSKKTVDHKYEAMYGKDDQRQRPLMAKFVEDVTLPPGTAVEAGESLVKIWKLRNDSRTFAWPEHSRVRFMTGERMGSSFKVPVLPCLSGRQIDVAIDIVIPVDVREPRRFVGYWQLCGPDETIFGDMLQIDVTAHPSKSTPPTADSSMSSHAEAPVTEEKQLAELKAMGFPNEQENRRVLLKNNRQMNRTIQELLGETNE